MDIKKAGTAVLTAFILFLAPMAVYAGNGLMQDTLAQNEKLRVSEELRSTNGKYTLRMQDDGNLVVYDDRGKGLWSSDTVGSGAVECVLQGDGNLLLKDRNGRVVWATNTDGYPNARLIMEDDGHVVLYKEGGVAFWSNGKINMGIKPDAPHADSAEDLEAGKAAIFMRGGEMIVGEVVDISSTRLVLQLKDGREYLLDRIWMINFISTGWNFPEERKRLENNEHYLFFKNDQITSGRITDFSSTRRVFQFDTKEEVPIGRVRRIYFTNQLPPAYMSLLGEEGTGQKPRYVGTIAPAAYNANTGDNDFDNALNNLNNAAHADLDNFMNTLSGAFDISKPWIENLIKRENIPPADVYMIARTASVIRQPIGTVEKNYRANRGQGWGVIAKRLGIKPGSEEFHALKKDNTGWLLKEKSHGQKKDDKKNS